MKLYVEENYARPMVLSHQPIRFETAQSCNPGKGIIPPNNHQTNNGKSPGCGKATGQG
ncbi:hypothetical protein ACFFIX_00470 [Metabacillus herbersteinensis]|uniref:Uncharacterized protein n=1 Tax=Metabacillus herbersteinensis TaxID=283816 RepID=A0ABV6G970_9BACI